MFYIVKTKPCVHYDCGHKNKPGLLLSDITLTEWAFTGQELKLLSGRTMSFYRMSPPLGVTSKVTRLDWFAFTPTEIIDV